VSGALAAIGGNITESQQYGDPDSGRFFMRVQVQATPDRHVLDAVVMPVAERFQMDWRLDTVGRPLRTIVMVSKAPHCLLDLLYRRQQERLPIDVAAVVSNHPDLAPVAEFYGVPFHLIPVSPESKDQAEVQLKDLVTDLDVELVVLARYMQILSDSLCEFLAGRAINIHHSFLPSFKGARPYAQAHARGVKLIGATAHYVTAALDEGPIIEQDVERVDHSITPEGLAHLGEDVERRALARAVRWHAEHRVLLNGARTVVFP
jgi:formyltetrahydrofolate deformylase